MSRAAFLATTALAVAALGFQVPAALGKHSWNKYHWYRSINPATLDIGDNVSETWDAWLLEASFDWSKGRGITILDTSVVDGLATDPLNCGPTDGRIEVCNAQYGSNGWLGLAQIWVSGGHITKGVAKLNDTYFNGSTYNTPEWRDFVMCQEVGHTFGLGHQDESFWNPDKVDESGVETCMDYTNRPAGNGQPNDHDYEQLEDIYNHLDGSGTAGGPGSGKGGGPKRGKGSGPGKLVAVTGFEFAAYVRDDPNDWGTAVAFTNKGQPLLFVKDLGEGEKLITHVLWTEDARAGAHFPHH